MTGRHESFEKLAVGFEPSFGVVRFAAKTPVAWRLGHEATTLSEAVAAKGPSADGQSKTRGIAPLDVRFENGMF